MILIRSVLGLFSGSRSIATDFRDIIDIIKPLNVTRFTYKDRKREFIIEFPLKTDSNKEKDYDYDLTKDFKKFEEQLIDNTGASIPTRGEEYAFGQPNAHPEPESEYS